jgi:hypothetical protein
MALFVIYKELNEINSRPIGENSPNLVTQSGRTILKHSDIFFRPQNVSPTFAWQSLI